MENKLVWSIFDEITRVPRPSKKEGKIIAFLENFAKEHNLDYRKDAIGNIVMIKPATSEMEDRPTVVLQNHVDMVCEKNSEARNSEGAPFDFEHDAIQTYVADGWMRAKGTTLGADNGLGMAAVLALLIDKEAVHGPLEALFTVDEETGLTGAFNLGRRADGTDGPPMITGKYLINLDSEDEGEVFIGCAGGVDTLAYFPYSTEPVAAGYRFFEILVSGLKGGHSGDDIEKGRGNSNKILARALWVGLTNYDLKLSEIGGGNLRNAIPREARAVVAVPEGKASDFSQFIKKFAADIAGELQYTDAGVVVAVSTPTVTAPRNVIDADASRRLISALVGVSNGVQAMSFAMPGLVETSTNLASVKMTDSQIVVTTSQRSSVESAKRATAAAVEAVFALAGARVEHSEGYPGWAPNLQSRLLEITKKAYTQLFGEQIKVRAIHAGLECGLFLEKYPQLDMVSFGPTILGAHSPDERLEIQSVDKFWRLLLGVLKEIR